MTEDLSKDVWREREMNKFSLDTFIDERPNVFDQTIDNLIVTIKKQIEDEWLKHKKMVDFERNDPDGFLKSEEEAIKSGHSLYMEMFGYEEFVDYLHDELFALFEMKIIYAFKHLEINMKQLLSIIYKDKTISKHYKWESIISFLNSKNITLSTVTNYENIVHLKDLNNALKHSDRTVSQNIQKIKEFKDKDLMSYAELENFYTRIKKMPIEFLNGLISEIFKEQYIFDSERILAIAKSFAVRMEKIHAKEFAEKIMAFYK